jgi:hypothetical protein
MSPNGPAIWGGCVTRPVLTVASGRSTGHVLCSLASFVRRNDLSREGGKTVTSKTLAERSRHGIQGLWRAGNKSRYIKFYRKQLRGPDLSQ